MIMCIDITLQTTALIISHRRESMWKLLIFHTEMIFAWFLLENVLLGGEL